MILVTGGSGFLGKRVCCQLEVAGLPYVQASLKSGLDLRDRSAALRFSKAPPQCCSQLRRLRRWNSIWTRSPAEIFSNNLRITLNLLEAANELSVNRIVNPISNCAYPAKATFFKEREFGTGHCMNLYWSMALLEKYLGLVRGLLLNSMTWT